MFVHHYVIEKLMTLDAERASRLRHRELPPPVPIRSSRLLRAFGRALQAAGEGLESWAGPNGGTALQRDRFADPKYY